MLKKPTRHVRARQHRQKGGADLLQKFIDAHEKAASDLEKAYWRRPRIHLSSFKKDIFWERGKPWEFSDSKLAALSTAFGIADSTPELEGLLAALGSPERLIAFARLADAYRKDRSLRNYLPLRRQFPEAEIQVARFGGFEPILALKAKLQELGIDPQLVAGATDAFPPDVDELCLQIIERLVAKDDRRKGRGNRHTRDLGIQDSLVDYLILMMIERLDWDKSTRGLIPASLIVLLMERLGGSRPEWKKKYDLHARRDLAAQVAAQIWPSGKPPVRDLARVMKVGKSTAARWLKDGDFQRKLDWTRSPMMRNAIRDAIEKKTPKFRRQKEV